MEAPKRLTHITVFATLISHVLRYGIAVCNLLLSLLVQGLFSHEGSNRPARVLIVREGYIGDLLVALPAIAHVRPPGCSERTVALLTHPTSPRSDTPDSPAAELIRQWGFVDRIIYMPTRLGWPVRHTVKSYRADRVVFMPYTSVPMKSMLFQLLRLRLLGITVRPEGFRIRSFRSAFQTIQHETGGLTHQAVTALCAVGAPTPERRPQQGVAIPILPRARQTAREQLVGLGNRPAIVVGCSAKYWHKRWPADYYRQVMDTVAARHCVAWVLLGTTSDGEIAAGIERTSNAFTINLCGKLGLDETAEVIRMSALYLGNDTGLAHLSAALGVPTVTLFSGIHPPGIWEPWSDRNVTIRASTPCQPCRSERNCPTGDKRCLTGIRPTAVTAAVDQQLQRTRPYSMA